MDLVIIFPCSPGSYAELGMFSIIDPIASKLVIFIDQQHRERKGYLLYGPVKAAKLRRARIHYVDYNKKERIWQRVLSILNEVKARKRSKKLLSG